VTQSYEPDDDTSVRVVKLLDEWSSLRKIMEEQTADFAKMATSIEIVRRDLRILEHDATERIRRLTESVQELATAQATQATSTAQTIVRMSETMGRIESTLANSRTGRIQLPSSPPPHRERSDEPATSSNVKAIGGAVLAIATLVSAITGLVVALLRAEAPPPQTGDVPHSLPVTAPAP
jgi:hypothetical protein